jgi:archaeal cell division control protein 6
MGLFKDMLGSEESLFRDPIPLDYDYLPKLVPYREIQQKQVALCMKPLFAQRNGRNIFVHGPPGVGKTVAIKHLLKELEEETDDIVPIFINCWQKNTTYKMVLEVCEALNFKFTQNKKTDELLRISKDMLNKKSAVFVLDEIDKLEDVNFIYNILEDIYRKSIVIIGNYKEWLVNLDQRVKSRLTAELLAFEPYTKEETQGILAERLKFAFVEGVWEDDAFFMVVDKACAMKDIRKGLYLMKEAGNCAEEQASKKIVKEHVEKAIKKLDEFSVKKKDELQDDTKFILEIVKKYPGKKMGDLFKAYQDHGGGASYKTFQRTIAKLADGKFVQVKKLSGGTQGTTTIVRPTGSLVTLDDF